MLNKLRTALTSVAQLVGCPPAKPKGHWFTFQSGNMTELQVWSLIGAYMRGS